MNLDVVNCVRQKMVTNGDVIDIAAGCQTLLFTSLLSDVLKVKSGQVNPPTKYSTGADAGNASGSDGLLQLQIIRPSQRYWKVECDGGTKVLVQMFDNRNESVAQDATQINFVSVNSPDAPDLRA